MPTIISAAVLTLLTLVAMEPSHAANTPKWESLSDCQYIDAKETGEANISVSRLTRP
ncbi:MAG: hypothetical protein LH481_02920 [Burkholderiales bacterium]|nr:hypothetical protein [Burkholderiales bacterium]